MQVDYDDLHECQPHLGNEVNVCAVSELPTRLKWKCSRNKLYTLILIDLYPLGECRPLLLSQRISWWVVDIPGCDVASGLTLYQFQPPLPWYGAGKSKYVYLVYEQPKYAIDWSEEALVPST